MKRVAFRMKLKNASSVEEYKRRHDAIWPELKILLQDSGVSEYSIHFDESSLSLFAFQKVMDKGGSQDLGGNEIVTNWWEYMSDLMETNPDHSPVSVELHEVFYMD
jgi:L-rhamnose mutarotase